MKRIYSLPLLLILLFLVDFAAISQNITISGGIAHSAIICANGKVFTWGSNQTDPFNGPGNTNGILSNGATGTFDGTEREVTGFPTGYLVEQVDAGSGGHTVVKGCDGTVYAWGGNGSGQVGNGTFTNLVGTPTAVEAGDGTADASGNLSDIVLVTGGNQETYAIMSNGRALSWGSDAEGQLGNGGANTNSNTPTFVRTTGNAILENVVQIDGGDFQAYALVDDDGTLDGVGTAYSWGQSTDNKLGRIGAQNIALPVLDINGNPLGGLTQVTAGDVFGLALDTNGNVWAWGHNTWAGVLGQGNQTATPYAVKVLGGLTGDPFLGDVIQIAAARNTAYALLSTGEVVSWGGNVYANSLASQTGGLGDGTASGGMSTTPVFVKTNATTNLTNVASISDGDVHAFALTNDNRIVAWGANDFGQLGDGTTANSAYAIDIGAIPTCKAPDPIPTADLPSDFQTCIVNEVLDPGFANIGGNYTFTWYKDNGVIGGATGDTYTATDFGTYRVEIDYNGADAPCSNYPTAIDEVTITTFTTEYSDPGNPDFCPPGFEAAVNGSGVYTWYAASTGGTALDTTNGTALTDFTHTLLTDVVGNDYTVYVEELAHESGTSAASAQVTPTTTEPYQHMESQIAVFEDLYLETFRVTVKHDANPGTFNFQAQIFNGQDPSCSGNGLSADRGAVFATAATTFTFTKPGVAGTTEIDIPVDIFLPGSAAGTVYWVGFTTTAMYNPVVLVNGGAFPYVDDATGNILHVTGADKGNCDLDVGEYGELYNFTFSTTSKACTRVPVTVTLSCPCTAPGSTPSINGGGPFCDAGTLSGSIVGGAGNRYQWFLDGVAIGTPAAVVGSPAAVTSPSVTTTGVLTIRVADSDANLLNTGCYDESAGETITINTTPSAPTVSDDEACLNETVGALTGTGTGLLWYTAATGGSGVASVTPSTATATTLNYWVSQTVSGCESPRATQDFVVHALPTVTASSNVAGDEICLGESVTLSGSGATTYSWNNSVTNGASFSPTTTTTYTVTGTDGNTCENTDMIQITVHTLPTVTASSNATGDEVCDGDPVTLTGSGANTYTWDNGVTDNTPFTPTTTTTYTVTGVDANTCENTATIEVTVNDLPTATIAGNNTICDDGTTSPITITLTGTPDYDVTYDGDNSAPVNVTPHSTNTLVFNTSSDETFSVTAVQDANGCDATSLGGTAEITYHDEPVPDLGSIVYDCPNGVGTPFEYTVSFDISGGEGTGNYVIDAYNDGTTTAATVGGINEVGGVVTITGVDEGITLDVRVTDGNGCNPVIVQDLNQICSCGESITVSVSGDSEICEEGGTTSSELTLAFDDDGNGAPDWNFVLEDANGAVVQSHDYSSTKYTGTMPLIVTNIDTGTYFVKDVFGTCSGSGSGPVVVSYYPSPAAVISGTNSICNDGTTTPITIDVTAGTPNYTIDYIGTVTTPAQQATGITGQHVFPTAVAETWSIVGVTDANGCTAKALDLTGTAIVDHYDEPVPDLGSIVYDCPNGVSAPFVYTVTFDVSGGEGSPNYVLNAYNDGTMTPATIGSISESGGTVTITGVDEGITLDVEVTDGNGCNPVIVQDLNQVCSCGESITVSVSGATEICEEGTTTVSELTLAFDDDGSGTPDWNFVLQDANGATVQGHDYSGTKYSGATPLVVTNVDTGSYTVVGVFGSCQGQGSGPVDVSYHPSPAATISGTNSICDDGTTTPITIDVTAGTPNYTIDYIGTVTTPAQQATGVTGQHVFPSAVAETWSIVGITDANGCTAKAADLSGAATISHYTEAVVDLTSIDYACPNGQATPHEFTVTFDVSGGQGSGNYVFDELLAGTTTSAGFTATEVGGVVTISGVPENISLDVGVTDGNGCNPILVPDLNFICSCPTTATLSAVGGTEICDDGTSAVTMRITTAGGTGGYTFEVVNSLGINEASETNHTAFPYNFTVMADETYSIKTFYDNGETCEAGKTGIVDVTVHPLPTATLSATGASNICAGDDTDPFEVEFTGTAPFDYEYAIDGTGQGVIVAPSSPATIPGASVTSVYTLLSVEDDNGCVGTVLGIIPVQGFPRPEANISMIGGDICAGDAAPAITVTFTAGSQPFDIKYDNMVNPEQTAGPINATTYSIPGATSVGSYNYELTELSDANCPSIETGRTGNAAYDVNALPSVLSVSGSDDTICSNGSNPVTIFVSFSGEGPIDYTYTTGLGTVTSESTLGTSLSNQHTSAENGLHTITSVSDANGCNSTNDGSYAIIHSDPIVLTISGEDTVCRADDNVFLTVMDAENNPITWSTGEVDETIEATQTGTYWVQVDDDICPATSTRVTSGTVKIDEEPNVNISGSENSVVVFEGDPMILTGLVVNAADGLLWTSDNGLNGLINDTDTITSFEPIDGGIYNYTLTAINGECQNSASINVVVIQPVKIPNAFTPNGDGDNEVWDIRGMSTYNEAVIKIFNRWGNLVYEKFGTYKQWDGTHMNKGKDLPVGTYYYVIDLGIETPDNREPREKRGHVSIIR